MLDTPLSFPHISDGGNSFLRPFLQQLDCSSKMTHSTVLSVLRRGLSSHSTRLGPVRTFSASAAAASTSTFDTVGVVGLGLMGHGICQVAAASGIHSGGVVAYEPQQEYLDRGKDRIEKSIYLNVILFILSFYFV